MFLIYDLGAAVLMVGAAGVAWRLAWGAPGGPPRRLLVATLVGSVLALGRGVPAVVIDVLTWSGSAVGVLADVWFVLAGCAGVRLWWLARGESTLQ